ncbi:MAG: hypothetical protein GF344_11650 [Chitinivibrionales bacterium]|nr:hypothetical protein [Chitinivibrionales bacterium]MBD3357440.1 hypothetical protein [Chitinivibrionales bacterium]
MIKGLSEQPWFRKALVSMVGRPHLARFEKAARDVRATQSAVLKQMVDTAANTAFGRDHGLGKVRTVDEFRRAIPICDFEYHRPYVERMCRGETDVLFPGEALCYNTTSGTTAKPKLIPVSPDYFRNAYSGLSRLWLYSCLKDNPRLYDGKSLSAVAPAEDGTVEDGKPYGSISGMIYRNIPGILKSTYSVPYPLICIRDYHKKYYAMMRGALAADITYIISPSPSNLLMFHHTVMEHFDELVRDTRDGTLNAAVAAEIDPSVRDEALAWFRPDPRRSRELEQLMAHYGDDLRPKHYWPNLALVNVWKQGNFRLLLPRLAGYYPTTTVLRAFGYQASEGRAGLVLGNDWDYSALAAHIYHFEFVEESARNEAEPRTLLAHDVEVGKRYFLLFSNGSGLFRYDINDLVEITGFRDTIPLFRFIQKGEGITSITGEKLAEEQVIQAVEESSRARECKIEFYCLVCDEAELCYRFFVEFGQGVAEEKRRTFCDVVDRRLRALNPEYEIKRGSERLAQPIMFELRKGSTEGLKEQLIKRGLARAGQYKSTFLTNRPATLEILRGLCRKKD